MTLAPDEPAPTAVPASHTAARHWLGFITAGTLAFLTDAAVLEFLTRVLGLGPLRARLISIPAAIVVSWLGHRRLTFAVATPPTVQEFAAFLALQWSIAALNYAVYAGILIVRPPTPPFAALVIASVIAMAASYLGMRFGVFAGRAGKARDVPGQSRALD